MIEWIVENRTIYLLWPWVAGVLWIYFMFTDRHLHAWVAAAWLSLFLGGMAATVINDSIDRRLTAIETRLEELQ